MRILEINKFYYLRRGAERHFLDLISLLERRGHEVEVFAMDHPQNLSSPFSRFFPSYVGYYRSEATFWQLLKGIFRIFWSFEARRNMRRLLREWRPDVVHLHNIYHQLSPSILGPIKEMGIPIVMTVHDYNLVSPDKDVYHPEVGRHYWKYLRIKKYGWGRRLLLVLRSYWEHCFRFYDRAIDHYIVPSRFVFDTLKKAGLPHGKMSVIPHFVEVSNDPELIEKAKSEPHALYLGSLSSEKGVPALAKIFSQLRIPLTLAGSRGPGFALEPSEWVRLVGQKNREEVRQLIEEASCVVSASTLPETFGLIVLEANAVGKPFFGLNNGAFGEIVENGVNGFLAHNGKELERMISRFFAKEITFDSNVIRERTKKLYGADNFGNRFEELIEKVLSESKESELK